VYLFCRWNPTLVPSSNQIGFQSFASKTVGIGTKKVLRIRRICSQKPHQRFTFSSFAPITSHVMSTKEHGTCWLACTKGSHNMPGNMLYNPLAPMIQCPKPRV
jgi:hypothetical protein